MLEFMVDLGDYESQIKEETLQIAQKICEEALLQEEILNSGEVSFSVVSQEEIQDLNSKYRNIDKVTDVLSFPLNTINEIEHIKKNKDIYVALGDIIICYDRALEQSVDFNHSIDREILYLTCHSILHLLGYDHMNDDEKKIMREKEEKILEKLNITRDY